MNGVPLNFYASRDVGVTQRLPFTALLAIDSEDRFSNLQAARDDTGALSTTLTRTPYSFTITKNESIMNGFFTRLGLSEMVLPWIIPNINPKTNAITVLYNVGAGPVIVTLTLPNGFYRPAELATAMQIAVRALNAGLSAFTIVYGANNLPNFSYATNNPAATIAFLPMTQSLVPGPNYYPYDTRTTRQLFDVLGFTTENVNTAVADAGGATFCQAITYVDVVCLQLTANQGLKDTMSQITARDVLARIYLTGNDVNNVPASSANFCPPGCAPFTVYRNFSQPKQIQWMPNQPVQSSLKFELYDDQGDNLSSSDPFTFAGANRTNWSLSILVSEN